MALGVILTLPGAPVLYYGDEVGLAGKSDPDSRRVMPAEGELSALETRTRALARALGQTRACSEALRRGTYRTLFVDAEHLIYARETSGGESAIVSLQRSTTVAIAAPLPGVAPGTWVDALSGEQLTISPALTSLPVAPFSVALYMPVSSPCIPGITP